MAEFETKQKYFHHLFLNTNESTKYFNVMAIGLTSDTFFYCTVTIC